VSTIVRLKSLCTSLERRSSFRAVLRARMNHALRAPKTPR